MKNILVVKLGALGDIFAATGCMKAIREAHHDDHITILTTPPYRRVLQFCPWFDDIMIDPRKARVNLVSLFGFLRDLKSKKFDCIYDLQANDRTRMYRRFIDAPWYFGWPNIATELKRQGFLLPVTVRPDVEWLIEDPAAILSANGIESEYIVLIPGSAARHLQKRWPAYSELADVLTASGYRPIIAPGPDEMEMAKAFNCPVLLQDGKPVSLTLLAGLVRNARYFVGNDTGPTHLAAYLGTKGLALFGPHASAQSTGLDRYLDIIEVSDLKRLPVHDVAERVNAAMTSDVH